MNRSSVERPLDRKGLLLFVAALAQFMVILDVSIVNVALPAIKTTLGFTTNDLGWILNAYTLSFAGLLLLGGRLGDIFGKKKIFIVGMVIFTVASLLGAVSNSQALILVARALQGLGSAIVSPATLTIITTSFAEGKERARALGIWSATAGAGGAAGALFGGVLTNYLSWRWTFLINVPVGVVEVLLAFLYISESRGEHKASNRLDVVGSLMVTLGLTSIVFGLVQGGNIGWRKPETIVAFVFGVVLLVGFLFYEARVAAAPIIPLSIFKYRALSAANAAMFLVGGSIFASWFFLSLFMQEVLGYSPLKAGLAFIPQTLAIIVGAQVSSRLIHKVGARPLIIGGPVITAVGLVLLGGITPEASYLKTLFIPSILITLGMGLCFTPLAFAATSQVDRRYAGLASGLLNTSRQVGGAVGLAALSTVAITSATNAIRHIPASASIAVRHASTLLASAHGYGLSMKISAIIAIGASLSALALPVTKSRGSEHADDAAIAAIEPA